MTAGGIVMIAIGLCAVYAGVVEIVWWLRSRRRRIRVTAVIVGGHEPAWQNPGYHGRSAVFRFTTRDGQVIDAVSAASTFPEPKAGRHVPVTYDPTDPQRSAERVGVYVFKLVLMVPLLIAGGLTLAGFGVTFI
jgi:Protein of unknown function (DUF3592)